MLPKFTIVDIFGKWRRGILLYEYNKYMYEQYKVNILRFRIFFPELNQAIRLYHHKLSKQPGKFPLGPRQDIQENTVTKVAAQTGSTKWRRCGPLTLQLPIPNFYFCHIRVISGSLEQHLPKPARLCFCKSRSTPEQHFNVIFLYLNS